MSRETLPRFDLYGELEVSPFANVGTIEAAYRSLVKQHHPDLASGDESRMTRLNLAREWLTDPELRRRFDRETDRGRRVPTGARIITRSVVTQSSAGRAAAGGGPMSSAASNGSGEPTFGIHADEVRQFLAELRGLDRARAQRVWNGRAVAHARGYTQALRAAASAARGERHAEWQLAREAASVIARGKLGDATLTDQVADVLSDVAGAIAIRDLLSPGEFSLVLMPWTWRGTVRLPDVPAPDAAAAETTAGTAAAGAVSAGAVSAGTVSAGTVSASAVRMSPVEPAMPPRPAPAAAPGPEPAVAPAPEPAVAPAPVAAVAVPPVPAVAARPSMSPDSVIPVIPAAPAPTTPRHQTSPKPATPFVAAAPPPRQPPTWPAQTPSWPAQTPISQAQPPEPRVQSPHEAAITPRLAAALAASPTRPGSSATVGGQRNLRPAVFAPPPRRPIGPLPIALATASVVVFLGAALLFFPSSKLDQAVAGVTDAPTVTVPGVALGSEAPLTAAPPTGPVSTGQAQPTTGPAGGGTGPTPRTGPGSTPRPTPKATLPPGATPLPTPAPTPAPTPPNPTAAPGPMCTVPNFFNFNSTDVAGKWSASGFTGAITYIPKAQTFVVAWQSLAANTSALCSSGITVRRTMP